MVCFEVVFAFKQVPRRIVNVMVDHRLEHLFKQYSAELKDKAVESEMVLYKVLVCDEDAVRLLRDVPVQILCVEVRIRKTGSLLYSNAKLTRSWIRPPQQLLLRRVYWSASKLEPKGLE